MKSKRLNSWHLFYVDMYRVNVCLYVGDQSKMLDTAQRFFKKKLQRNYKNIIEDISHYVGSEDNTSQNWCMESFDRNNYLTVIICVENINSDPETVVTLSHECLHAAFFIAHFCGIEDDGHGFESLVYLHERIFENFYKLKSSK